MRVISIGLDGRAAEPGLNCHVVSWVREIARHVDEYVAIAPSPDKQNRGPVALAPNASAWAVAGSPATFSFRAARLAARLHRERPFDVITTEDPVRCGFAGALLARRTGLPLNVENHSYHINESVWLREKLHHRLYNQVAIRICRRADSIRNYAPGQTRALLDIGVEPFRIHTVPINAPELLPMEENAARQCIGMGQEPFVLCAGRMVAYKNIPLLLQAFAGLPASLNTKLLMIGAGHCKSEWQAMAASLGLGERVVWHDAVPWDKMIAYYSAAAVFAAPAVHETGPRTVLEALLCGCPVVVTPGMAVSEMGICAHRETALVVGPDDVRGWTSALQELLMDREKGRRMAEAGRARIGPDISFSAIARRLVQVLQETVSRSGKVMQPLASA
jgi:phosphatidylinositol alpha 1,6-mannosyltransferase